MLFALKTKRNFMRHIRNLVAFACERRCRTRRAFVPLALAAVATLIAATPVTAQWNQDGQDLRDERWSKSDGGFGAQLFLTDKPDELFEAWENPAQGVGLSEAKTARQGVPIVAVVFFTGCAPDTNGLCQATVEFAAYRPDGKLYGDPSAGELWIDKPPPAKGQIQLSASSMGIVLDPDDPIGAYKLRAKVVDKVAGKTLRLEREFTAVEAIDKEPAPPTAAQRVKTL